MPLFLLPKKRTDVRQLREYLNKCSTDRARAQLVRFPARKTPICEIFATSSRSSLLFIFPKFKAKTQKSFNGPRASTRSRFLDPDPICKIFQTSSSLLYALIFSRKLSRCADRYAINSLYAKYLRLLAISKNFFAMQDIINFGSICLFIFVRE